MIDGLKTEPHDRKPENRRSDDGAIEKADINKKSWLKEHSKAALVSIIGFISAAAIPVWQSYFAEQAHIAIEVSSIQRELSDGFKTPLYTDELKILESYMPDHLLFEVDLQGKLGDKLDYPDFTLEVLQKAYEKARLHLKEISNINYTLSANQAEIDRFLDDKNHQRLLTEFRVKDLNKWQLSNYIDDAEATYYQEQLLLISRNYSEMKFTSEGEPEINIAALRYLLQDIREDLGDVIHDNEAKLEQLRDNINSISDQLENLAAIQSKNYSYFEIEVLTTNSGAGNTSLRPLGLLRVQVSDNNYVDIQLTLDDYEESSELADNSTNILHYRSKPLHNFRKDDRHLINNFWGSTGLAQLLVLDTNQGVHVSQRTAFADNLNQKVMLEHLQRVAAEELNADNNH